MLTQAHAEEIIIAFAKSSSLELRQVWESMLADCANIEFRKQLQQHIDDFLK